MRFIVRVIPPLTVALALTACATGGTGGKSAEQISDRIISTDETSGV